ncbi:MAG TPA: hypothetical protein VJT75_15895, partial [Thermoleophilaceae bacterium]|nr:hypothetical protein [Thermoleophilaceae bacterium]
AGVLLALLGGGGGGAKAGRIAATVPVTSGASSLAADRDGAVVAGPGSELTAVDNADNPEPIQVQGGLLHVAERGVAVNGDSFWLDNAEDGVVRIERRPGGAAEPVGVAPSRYHRLAATGDGILVLSPDEGTIERLDLDGALVATGAAPRGANHLAADANFGYALFKNRSDTTDRSIYTVDATTLDHAEPPAKGLLGTKIKTGDENLYVQHGTGLDVVRSAPGSTTRMIDVGDGVRDFDENEGWLWVTYADGTLKRFELASGSPEGDPLELPGVGIAVDARDDRAWVLLDTDKLIDVRP